MRRTVVLGFAALVATIAVLVTVAPGRAHAFAWKDECVMGIVNSTKSPTALTTGLSILAELPPNPVDEYDWETVALSHVFPPSIGLFTVGIPVPTFGCSITPTFKWYGKTVACRAYAPSSGKNVFHCDPNYAPQVDVQILTDNDDIKGAVIFKSLSAPGATDPFSAPAPTPLEPAARTSSATAASSSAETKRVAPLLRRADLPGRGWRAAKKVGQLGWFGQIVAADNLPGSCEDAHKSSEPVAERGGSSAFTRGSEIVGYEHGVYANVRQSRRTLTSAISTRGIRCLARLLTSAKFHTRVNITRSSLPGMAGVTLWRLIVRTRTDGRVTRVDYLDVAGVLHQSSNALALFANGRQPVRSSVEQAAIHTVASRLP